MKSIFALLIALAVVGMCEAKGGGGGHASSSAHSSSSGAHSAPAKAAPRPAKSATVTVPARTSWWPFGGGSHTSCNKEKDKDCR